MPRTEDVGAADEARRLARALADSGDASDAVGFVEGIHHLQARQVDGRLTSQVSRIEGGFSRTASTEGRWAMGAVPWERTSGRGHGDLDAAELALLREAFTAADDSVASRREQLLSHPVEPPPGCSTETIIDVVTRRRAVARRGEDPHVEVSHWARRRSRVVDLRRGLEIDRRQWIHRGSRLDGSAGVATVGTRPQPSTDGRVRSGRHTTPVVLEGAAAACLLHELVGHVAEQDSLSRPTPYAAQAQEIRDAHPELTVADDPLLPDGAGTHGVDDEGTATRRVEIMTRGVFASGLGTVLHPSPVSGAGCARRDTYAGLALPRASNTVLTPGTATHEDLFAGPEVLVVTGFASGYVVPTTGDFQFVATRCRLEGRSGAPVDVGDVLVNGNALEVLRSICAVGSDPSDSAVTCGKRDQWVVVSMSSPSVRIDRLEWSCA